MRILQNLCVRTVLAAALLGLATHALQSQQIAVDSLPGQRLTWEMVRVPAGDVRLTVDGVTSAVTVDSFWIARTELPWELYDVYALRLDVPRADRARVDAVSRPSNPYGAPDRGFGHRGYPAISVTHSAAVAFAAWLSERTGHRYAVASDAQWQRAADLAFAGIPASEYAAHTWFADNAEASTHALAQRRPDALGLFDLLGNAAEWVTGTDGTPWLRGGSYQTPAAALAPGLRERQVPSWNQTDPQDPKSRWWLSDGPFAGFRLVRIP